MYPDRPPNAARVEDGVSRLPSLGPPIALHPCTVDFSPCATTHQSTPEKIMSSISNLSDLYVDELKDLWSANDQMARALKKIAPKATHSKLKQMLEKSQQGIAGHTDLLKALIANQGNEVSKEHCKGMEGLVSEAISHTIDDGPEKGPVLDAAIIAQVQRMTHYGITGFGTVAAFAKALKLNDDNKQLKAAVKDMYIADELMTELAEAAVNEDAVDE